MTLLVFVFLLFSFSVLSPEVMENICTTHQDKHTIVFLSDWHRFDTNIAQEQYTALTEFLSKAHDQKKSIHFLIEGPADFSISLQVCNDLIGLMRHYFFQWKDKSWGTLTADSFDQRSTLDHFLYRLNKIIVETLLPTGIFTTYHDVLAAASKNSITITHKDYIKKIQPLTKSQITVKDYLTRLIELAHIIDTFFYEQFVPEICIKTTHDKYAHAIHAAASFLIKHNISGDEQLGTYVLLLIEQNQTAMAQEFSDLLLAPIKIVTDLQTLKILLQSTQKHHYTIILCGYNHTSVLVQYLAQCGYREQSKNAWVTNFVCTQPNVAATSCLKHEALLEILCASCN